MRFSLQRGSSQNALSAWQFHDVETGPAWVGPLATARPVVGAPNWSRRCTWFPSMRADPCPVCHHAFDDTACKLASRARAGEAARSVVCARCTAVVTTVQRSADPGSNYNTRVWGGPPRSAYIEHRGQIREHSPTQSQAARQQRVEAVCAALPDAPPAPVRVGHVGCQSGWFLDALASSFDGPGSAASRAVELAGFEPWQPWRARSERWDVRPTTVEDATLPPQQRFDVLVEFDLLDRLADPVAHLRALRGALRPGGAIVVEVADVLRCAGGLRSHRLRTDAPVGFTRTALEFACAMAGFDVHVERRAGVLCATGRVAQGEVRSPAPLGPHAAGRVAEYLREDDTRLLVTAAVFDHGLTRRLHAVASRLHASLQSAALRERLSRDLAEACAEAGDLVTALGWTEAALRAGGTDTELYDRREGLRTQLRASTRPSGNVRLLGPVRRVTFDRPDQQCVAGEFPAPLEDVA